MIFRDTVRKVDNFDRAQAYTTTPAGAFGWTIADTSAAGTPTYLNISGGGAKLLCDNTSEAQVVCLYQNDVLPFLLNKIHYVKFIAQVAGIDAVTTLTMGIGSARNSTADSVATNAWFRMEGSASTSAIVAETDDGTTDNDDKATGTTLAAVDKEFIIDFSKGLSDVRFFVDGAPVATGTTFSMAAASSTQQVQLLAQLQKASGTGVPSVTIKRVEIQYDLALGS